MPPLPLTLLAVVLAAPLSRGDLDAATDAFAAAHPDAQLVRAAKGGLEHASRLALPRGTTSDEDSALAFLAREGRAFGVGDAAELTTVRVWSAPGADGTALFRRTVAGLPVFGGEVAVGWRADGAITVVNGARLLAAEPRGVFRATAEDARTAALSAVPGTPGESRVAQGWLQYDGALVPVFRVEHDVLDPLESFTSYVDGDSGLLLYRVPRRRSAVACPPCTQTTCVCAFRDSPLAPPTTSPDGNAPEAFQALGLTSPGPGSTLTGTRTSVFNCLAHLDPPNCTQCLTTDPSTCTTQHPGDPSGNFLANPDPTQRQVDDVFAEQSAYYHIDSHSRFIDSLDPPGFGQRTPAGGIGLITGYVNVFDHGAPLDNAFFQPSVGAGQMMVYGQGTFIDGAYDAEIVYHELTHAAVDHTASFEEFTDTSGAVTDPGSLNEGTADTFAFAHIAQALSEIGLPITSASCLSPYFGAEFGVACLRQAANAKTCRGNGPNDGSNPGRDGEVHDDGEIWTGFTWALLSAADANRERPAMAKALFKALEAVGPHPTYQGYAQTVVDRMSATQPPMSQAAIEFASCTILQRDIAGCSDRAVALFSGERAGGGFNGIADASNDTTAGQQYFVDVPCGATALHVQTGDANGAGRLYVRYGKAVDFAGAGFRGPHYDWLVDGDRPDLVLSASGCDGCSLCSGTQTPFGAGRWYFLPAGSAAGPGGGPNAFQLGVSIEMPAGETPPARARTTIGAPGSTTDQNVCTWGGGPVPANPISPVSTTPPPLGCSAPATPAALQAPASCPNALVSTSPKSGCGCGAGAPGAAALVLLALLAVRRRT